MAFAPGDEVHVAALGKGIVRAARNGGRCLVELKAAVHACLKQLAVARAFRVDPVNEGVTIVSL